MWVWNRDCPEDTSEDDEIDYVDFDALDISSDADATSATLPVQSLHRFVAKILQSTPSTHLAGAAALSYPSYQLAGDITQPHRSLQSEVATTQTQTPCQISNATTPAWPPSGMPQELMDKHIPDRTRLSDDVPLRRLEAGAPRRCMSSLSSNLEPHLRSTVGAKTTIADLPYDVIYTICNHIVELYPVCPLKSSKRRRRNKITDQFEERLELNSVAIPRIIAHLNAGAAWADMENLILAEPKLESHVKASMESMRTITLRRRPLRIDQIWFEDLSWVVASLNQFGCANISTMAICWDNRERNTVVTLAPRSHRSEFAAAKLFNRLRNDCPGLNTLHIKLALENLCTRKPDGQQRVPPTKDYHGICGMDELKALVQAVRSKVGGGKVTIELDVTDSRNWGQRTLVPGWSCKGEEKTALVSWLGDGEPVELKAIEEEVEDPGPGSHCGDCDKEFCAYAGL